MKLGLMTALLVLASVAAPAFAGPPYLTDDPVPTETGHWEIYGFTAGEGFHSSLDDDVGFDLNYGAVKGVQLTATLPMSLSHEPAVGWRSGTGDVELGVKIRLINDENAGVSASIFPRAVLPTASRAHREKTRILLPLWVGKDFAGGTSVFGGGGYQFNPGPGNRGFWLTSAAVTHDLNKQVSIGAELTWQQSDTTGGTSQTRAGVGSIIKLSDRYAVLMSGGPTWADHRVGYHFYAALGLDF